MSGRNFGFLWEILNKNCTNLTRNFWGISKEIATRLSLITLAEILLGMMGEYCKAKTGRIADKWAVEDHPEDLGDPSFEKLLKKSLKDFLKKSLEIFLEQLQEKLLEKSLEQFLMKAIHAQQHVCLKRLTTVQVLMAR